MTASQGKHDLQPPQSGPTLGAIAGLIVVAAASRLLPHPPNFTPVGAIALFGGATLLDRRLACALPLGAMLLSDAVLGFHKTIPFVYGALLLIVCLGRQLQTCRRRPTWLLGGSLAASALFFLVTNLGVWLAGDWYPQTAAGLVACYVEAIPFFGSTVLGDLVFCGVLFGGLAVVEAMQRRAQTPLEKPFLG